MTLAKPIHLEKVSERFILDLSLKLEAGSPLHVGAGSEGVNKMLLKFVVNGKTFPIIPAESLKGVLRSLAFSLSKQILPDNWTLKYHVKDRHVKRRDVEKNEQKRIIESYLEKAEETLESVLPKDFIKEMAEGDKLQLIEYYFALNCPVCKLFGAQGVSGKLILSDGITNISPRFFTYTSTSINRKTRIVEENRLYNVAAVKPDDDLRYRVRIIGDNIYKGTEEAKLLSAVLQWVLRLGLQVGGLKSYGYGRFFIDENESTVKLLKLVEDPQSDETLLNNVRALLLKNGYFQVMKIDDFTKWLK
jgi:CRISPR/Cas system CSM-associated protein Csm3 (group 7 of RAMP superfamily)